LVTTILILFVVAYAAIALEHPLGINKSASALLGAGVLWTLYAVLGGSDHAVIGRQLDASVSSTAQIVFFLMGAMTIVEVIDAHNGFEIITSLIRTRKQVALIWIVCLVTFVLSAVLDNLTTTIVMISLLKRILSKAEDRLFFAAMIVIAANAGGAWSVIGDVTTTMLWIGGQITPVAIIGGLLPASLVSMLIPLLVVSYLQKGKTIPSPTQRDDSDPLTTGFERNLVFFLGLLLLIAVPAFKTLTHLPPFMGILTALGVLWLVGELIHRGKEAETKRRLMPPHALARIDMSSIVFFIGILLAVATLEHTDVLKMLAEWLDRAVGSQELIVLALGLLSAIVDNVPLVAAIMSMYSLSQHATDSFLWQFVAYCAGTGGSILIIGSAAGVAAMGLEKIHFFWYVKRISGLALLGYLGGAALFVLQYRMLH
jgi:Na+/H+ antiporter NhaD/arsenite permease-like protein